MRKKRISLAIIPICIIVLIFISAYLFLKDSGLISKNNQNLSISISPLIRDSQATYILPITQPNYLPIRNWSVLEPDIGAKAAIVFDTKSGRVLFDRNLKTKLPIASITKLASAIVVMENINFEDIIYISEDSLKTDDQSAPDFVAGEEILAKDLLIAMLVKSSNDSAMAFEEHLSKKGINMVDLMNKKAQEIDMLDTHFTDPTGLNDRGYSTVDDLVKLLKNSSSYTFIVEALKMNSFSFQSFDKKFNHEFMATDKLLNVIPNIEIGKTGYTEKAGGTMALMVGIPQYNSSIISIVLGSNNRFDDTKKLIDWAKRAHRWD